MTSETTIYTNQTNQTTIWLVCNWSTFGARMSHKHTWTHKIHHGSNLGEATIFSLVVFSVINQGGYIQMSFCLGLPSWESRNSQNWNSHDFGGP
jgi:hypothetical protein